MADLNKDQIEDVLFRIQPGLIPSDDQLRKIKIALSMAMRTFDAEAHSVKMEEIAVTQRAALEAALNKLSPDRAKVKLPAHDIMHRMQDAARLVRMGLPDHAAFFLFVGEIGDGPGRRAHYVADMQRDDSLAAMVEFLIENGVNPGNWGKHTL